LKEQKMFHKGQTSNNTIAVRTEDYILEKIILTVKMFFEKHFYC